MKKNILILILLVSSIFTFDACGKLGVEFADEIRITGTVKDIENDTFVKNAELVLATSVFLLSGSYSKKESHSVIDGRFNVIYKYDSALFSPNVFIGRVNDYEVVQSDRVLNFTGASNHFDLKIKPLKKLIKIKLTDNTVDSILIRTISNFLNTNEDIFTQQRKFIKIPKFILDTTIILQAATNQDNYIDYWKFTNGKPQILWDRVAVLKDTVTVEIK